MSNIVIVGAGVVGQATGNGFAKQGHQITYVDVDVAKIKQLVAQGLRAMTIAQVDWNQQEIVMLTVSTPTVQKRLILDHIKAAAHNLGKGLATTDKYITVVVRSTVPPTTTEKVLTPILEESSGKRAGVDFGVAYNPEFLRQRTSEQDFDRPWITVLGAADRKTMDVLNELYMPFGGLVVNCRPSEAEMVKYVNNVYNAVKISYFNEVHHICEHLGIDSRLVGAVVARSAESMWNPLYGTRGGVPYGGACLPKDTLAFMEFCRHQGLDHEMLAATILVNDKLEANVPAVASPEEIDQILKLHLSTTDQRTPVATPQPAKPLLSNGHQPSPFVQPLAVTAAD
ncbi:MAG: nucleotide sugar dehydrogenase [Caldilineaceae bacterium]